MDQSWTYVVGDEVIRIPNFGCLLIEMFLGVFRSRILDAWLSQFSQFESIVIEIYVPNTIYDALFNWMDNHENKFT